MANRQKTFRRWFSAHVDGEACRCIREYGIAAAAPSGLIYYSDTAALYRAYKEEIWDIVIGDCGCLEVFAQGITNPTMFENYMVWMAATRLAFER